MNKQDKIAAGVIGKTGCLMLLLRVSLALWSLLLLSTMCCAGTVPSRSRSGIVPSRNGTLTEHSRVRIL